MKDELEARMLSGEPFTWAQLGGSTLVDQTIQRLRKRGLIEFKRQGRNCVWRATRCGGTAKADIEAKMAELVDLLAVHIDVEVDPRAWRQLLIYVPKSDVN